MRFTKALAAVACLTLASGCDMMNKTNARNEAPSAGGVPAKIMSVHSDRAVVRTKDDIYFVHTVSSTSNLMDHVKKDDQVVLIPDASGKEFDFLKARDGARIAIK